MIFPYALSDCLWLVPAALVLDLWLGDSSLPWPHPVCILGKWLSRLEATLRKLSHANPLYEKITGFIAVTLTAGLGYCVVWFLITLPYVGFIFSLYFAWAGLAMGCLLDTEKNEIGMVGEGILEEARIGVVWLASRDISSLDRPMLAKTLADTLSENFTDVFMAPFFWLVFTGHSGIWFLSGRQHDGSKLGLYDPEMAGPRLSCGKK